MWGRKGLNQKPNGRGERVCELERTWAINENPQRARLEGKRKKGAHEKEKSKNEVTTAKDRGEGSTQKGDYPLRKNWKEQMKRFSSEKMGAGEREKQFNKKNCET